MLSAFNGSTQNCVLFRVTGDRAYKKARSRPAKRFLLRNAGGGRQEPDHGRQLTPALLISSYILRRKHAQNFATTRAIKGFDPKKFFFAFLGVSVRIRKPRKLAGFGAWNTVNLA